MTKPSSEASTLFVTLSRCTQSQARKDPLPPRTSPRARSSTTRFSSGITLAQDLIQPRRLQARFIEDVETRRGVGARLLPHQLMLESGRWDPRVGELLGGPRRRRQTETAVATNAVSVLTSTSARCDVQRS